jgi:exopolysaccharide production protein ExoZ
VTFPAIQVLRAVAALAVVYYHAVVQLRTGLGRADPALAEFGAWGVDLFFVISGFVMWTSTAGRTISPGEFYRRRIVRIAPLYWGVTAFAALVALAAPHLLRSTVVDGAHVAASFLFVPWPNPGLPPSHPDVLSPLVIPGWTLNYEMFFYLLFGACLLVPQRVRPLAIAVFLVGSMIVARHLAPTLPIAAFYGSTMLLEFLGGVLIGVVAERLRWNAPDRLAWVAVGALVVALSLAEAAGALSSRALYLGPLAAATIAVAVAADRNRIERSPSLQTLGDASYSIYLIHIFVIAGLRVALTRSGFEVRDVAGELAFVATAVIASAGAGYVLHRVFERPATLFASRVLPAPRRPAPLPC